jgi:hypothetical protein
MSRTYAIAVFVCCVMLPSSVRGQAVTPDSPGARGYLAGRETGQTVRTGGAALLGVVSGLVGGVSIPIVMWAPTSYGYVGTSVASVAMFVGALRLGTDIPRDQEGRIQGQPAAFRDAFRRGYADEVRNRRKVPALVGGAIGAAIGGVFIWYVKQALSGD